MVTRDFEPRTAWGLAKQQFKFYYTYFPKF
jgi:hypothetical protein